MNTKQSSARVSVLVVVYNAGDYLIPAIQSVLDQTYEDFELLVLDNSSTDGSIERLNGFSDLRIRIFRSTVNLGAYGGLNRLLEEAKGEYVAIQDHDDIWHPEKLEIQVAYLDSMPNVIGCGTAMTMYYEADGKWFEYALPSPSNYCLHPSLLFRFSGLQNERYENSVDYMCDALFQKRSLSRGKNLLANIPQTLALHLIKGAHGNYSYRWFRLSSAHLRRLYDMHGFSAYSALILSFEVLRKTLYPILNKLSCFSLIAKIERFPFRISGFCIESGNGSGNTRELISRLYASSNRS